MPAVANRYGDRRTRLDGAAPGVDDGSLMFNSSYMVPSVESSEMVGYTTGYATELDPSYASGTTPDPIRTGEQKPPINDPNNRAYWRRRTGEFFERMEDANETHREPWGVHQDMPAVAQNPLWTQERPSIRPTADDSPTGYYHTRDWHIPRFLHDINPDIPNHVSMADHRRQYEVFGMRSRDKVGVNNFRSDPVPWDQGLYPPDQTQTFTPPNTGVTPGGAGRFRL